MRKSIDIAENTQLNLTIFVLNPSGAQIAESTNIAKTLRQFVVLSLTLSDLLYLNQL